MKSEKEIRDKMNKIKFVEYDRTNTAEEIKLKSKYEILKWVLEIEE